MLTYEITTPEHVHFRYRVGGLGSRGVAWLLDQLIILASTVGLVVAVVCGGAGSGLATAVFFVAKFALDFGYFGWFEMKRSGQTLGKRAMKLRVVSSDGGTLRFSDVAVRTLCRPIDGLGMLPLVVFPGAVVAWVDRYHRRLGDLAAGTLVVRDAPASLPRSVVKQLKRVNSFEADPAVRARVQSRAGSADRRLMFELMMRRDTLDAESREALFADAAAYWGEKFDLPGDVEHLSDEQVVLNLALVVQSSSLTG